MNVVDANPGVAEPVAIEVRAWTPPPVVTASPPAGSSPGLRWPHVVAGSIAFLIQALAVTMFMFMRPAVRVAQIPDAVRVELSLIDTASAAPPAPALKIVLETPAIQLPLPEMQPVMFEQEAGLRGIEPPRVDPGSTLDLAVYSARASLPPGQIATVVILVDIAADGRVTRAMVVRSTGNASADAAALDYAREIGWIAGRIAGEPRPMQASLSVTLGAAAPAIAPGTSITASS
jgi:TonB family protein